MHYSIRYLKIATFFIFINFFYYNESKPSGSPLFDEDPSLEYLYFITSVSLLLFGNYDIFKVSNLDRDSPSDEQNDKSSCATACRPVERFRNRTFIAEPRESSGAIPVNIHVNHSEVHSIKYYASPRTANGYALSIVKPAAAWNTNAYKLKRGLYVRFGISCWLSSS